VARQEGALWTAESFLQQSLEVSRAIGSPMGEAAALQSLGAVALSRGAHDRAQSLHGEALALLARMERPDEIAASLRALGTAAAAAGRSERGARLLGAAEALREGAGGAVPPRDRAGLERAVRALRSGLGAATLRREWEAGRRLTVGEAVRLAREATPAPATEERGSRDGRGGG
jgi:hypothetical protein